MAEITLVWERCSLLLEPPHLQRTLIQLRHAHPNEDKQEARSRRTDLGVLTQTIPMWQKKMHSLSFWFSQEQRFSLRWAPRATGPTSSGGPPVDTQGAGGTEEEG